MHTPITDTSRMPQTRWDALSKILSRYRWLKTTLTALMALISVQVFAVMPLQRQIVALTSELENMHFALDRLVDVGDQTWQTNDLLTALETQAIEFDAAVGSLQRLQELQNEVIALSQLADQARMQLGPSRDAIIELTELENELAAHAERISSAEATVAEFASLQSSLLSQVESLTQARNVIDQQADLAATIVNGHETIATAEEQLHSYQNLAQQVIAAGEHTEQAGTIVGELIALQDTLLDDQRIQVAQADENLKNLMALQDTLAGETDRVADAVVSLELLADFQDEFHFQISQLETMQQSLTQLVLLESTVARAVRMIEPLAELTDLRRLDDDEVREAARIILERRETRVSSLPDDAPPVETVSEDAIERLVPIPPEE